MKLNNAIHRCSFCLNVVFVFWCVFSQCIHCAYLGEKIGVILFFLWENIFFLLLSFEIIKFIDSLCSIIIYFIEREEYRNVQLKSLTKSNGHGKKSTWKIRHILNWRKINTQHTIIWTKEVLRKTIRKSLFLCVVFVWLCVCFG